jgi:3-oxosteroid 1-dehydrogenase
MPQRSRRRLLRAAAMASAAPALPLMSPAAHAASGAPAHTVDVLVVGSGAAGMSAALSAALGATPGTSDNSLNVLVIDKAATFGGSTARSGAGIWVRNNEVLQAAGVVDSPEAARAYLDATVGPEVPPERKAAYLQHGPAAISFLLRHTPLRFRHMAGYSEYHPEAPGGIAQGASIEPDLFDGKLLGAELARLAPPYLAVPPGVAIFGGEYKWLNLATVNAQGTATAAKAVARYAGAKLRGETPLTMGQALAAGLRAGLLQANVPVWLDTPLLDLQQDAHGRVTGAWVMKAGVRTLITARRGVVLAAGGFEHNLAMRQRWQQQPITTDWTVGAASNTGDGIQAGERAGAALGLMDDAWWGPVIPLPDGPYFVLSERTLPGCIMVDSQGQRFVNEAAPYTDFVHTLYQRVREGRGDRFWMLLDQRHRNRYLFKETLPGFPLPKAWFDAGVALKAASLDELAARMAVNPATLRNTVNRFNGFAQSGQDADFQRGDSAYDHYYTDPAVRPNSCLAPINQGPYYAFAIVPGDLGTKGGLQTDARARVLRADGRAIPGLYAAGNTSASVMGHSYPGAGATIGPALTFGYMAGMDLAETGQG